MPISAPHIVPGSSGRGRIEKLVELDMAIGLLYRDDRVAQLDQVLLLHIEQLLTNFLGLLFRRKCDFYKIGHFSLPHAVAEPIYS
jgi:hypothetical protein